MGHSERDVTEALSKIAASGGRGRERGIEKEKEIERGGEKERERRQEERKR